MSDDPETAVGLGPTRETEAWAAWSQCEDAPRPRVQAPKPRPKPKPKPRYHSWDAAYGNALVLLMVGVVLAFVIAVVGWTLSQDQDGQPAGVVPGYTPGPFQP